MQRRIKRTPANIAPLGVIVAVLGAWLGLLLLSPGGEHPNHAAASVSATTDLTDHAHTGPPGSVADLLRSEAPAVGFCVSAALEPFDGAVAQIRDIGPMETGERFRRCLIDTMFDHATESTLAEIETHRPHFTDCFGALATRADSVKAIAVEDTLV